MQEDEEEEAKVIKFARWREHFFRGPLFASPSDRRRLLAPRGSPVIFIYEPSLSPATNLRLSRESGRQDERIGIRVAGLEEREDEVGEKTSLNKSSGNLC